MRQTPVALQRLRRRRWLRADGRAERQRGHGIRDIVATDQRDLVRRDEQAVTQCDAFATRCLNETKLSLTRTAHAVAGPIRALGDESGELGMVAIDDRVIAGQVNARLCGGIVVHVAVSIEMIRRNIQDYARRRRQRSAALKLEARQFQHVEVGFRVQQIQRRRPDVAADDRFAIGRVQDRAKHRGDRALAVRPGHRDDRRRALRDEQIDVADDLKPPPPRFDQQRRLQVDAG